jgi:bacillithiol synthase
MSRARAARSGRAPVLSRLQIVPRPATGSPLLDDFVSGDAALAAYYFGHFGDAAAYARKAREVGRRFDRARREAIAPALQPVSSAAAAKLSRVIEADGYVVTTGQQAGLFGGPLYTLYKALTAVRLAAALEPRLGRPVLPVFWIASEDHDWAEVDHTVVCSGDDRLVRLGIERAADAPEASMARQPLEAGVRRAVAQLEALLPQGPGRERLTHALNAAYRPGAMMGEAFRTLLADLLADLPVCTLSAADPVLKRLSVPLLRAELERSEAHDDALRAQTDRLQRAGYAAPVAVEPAATQLHYEGAAGRERLLRARGGFLLRRTKRRFTPAQLTAELEAAPWRISPGALLRPVVESALLPTLAYVGGPAEIGYFAQIGCLFRCHGLAPPIVYPRRSFLLVEARIERLLRKLGIGAPDITADAETLARRHLDATLPDDAGAALGKLRLATAEGWSRVRAAANAIDPTLEVPLRRTERASLEQIDEAERRLRRHHRRRHEREARQLERVCAQLRPTGEPQERVLNALPFIAAHGYGMSDRIMGAIDIDFAVGDRWPGPGCPP